MNLIAIETSDGTPSAPESGGGFGVAGAIGGVLGLVLSIYCGVRTWKNGHKVLFFVGLFFPVLWLVGALWRQPAPQSPRLA